MPSYIDVANTAKDCFVRGCNKKVDMEGQLQASVISGVPSRLPYICPICKRPACQECDNKHARGEKLFCKLCDEFINPN